MNQKPENPKEGNETGSGDEEVESAAKSANEKEGPIPRESLEKKANELGPIDDRSPVRKAIAILLVSLFGMSFVLHYSVCAYLAAMGKADVIKALTDIFAIWLPAIAGLTGTAVAYYFAKQ
jgi:hypothetical protein